MNGNVIEKRGFCQRYYDLEQPFLNTYNEDNGSLILRPWQNEYVPQFGNWVIVKSFEKSRTFRAAWNKGKWNAILAVLRV